MKKKDQRGISVLFAILYMGVGAVLIVGLLKMNFETTKRMADSQGSLESENVTNGAITLGLKEMAKHGPGWEGKGTHEVEIFSYVTEPVFSFINAAFAQEKGDPPPEEPAKEPVVDPNEQDVRNDLNRQGVLVEDEPNPAPVQDIPKEEGDPQPGDGQNLGGQQLDGAGADDAENQRQREARTTEADWKIYARPDATYQGADDFNFNDFYSVPNIGTGTAGDNSRAMNGEGCMNRRAPRNDPDDACNWNKLTVLKPAVLPLYVTITDPITEEDKAINPWKDFPGAELKIRLRTPCTPDDDGNQRLTCDSDERYTLDVDLDDLPDTNQTIVNWEILARCDNGRACSLLADTEKDKDSKKRLNIDNTEITELRLNKKRDEFIETYVILLPQTGDYSTGWINGDKNKEKGILEFLREVQKPTLQLSLLHSPKDIDGNQINYLEYQILVKDLQTFEEVGTDEDKAEELTVQDNDNIRTTAGITDYYTTIKAKGFSGKYFKKFIKRIRSMKPTRGGFVLE